MALKFLAGTVTQSGADTFTSAEISTGLANVNVGLRVRMFELYMPAPAEVDSTVTLQLARRSITASLAVTDRRLMVSHTNVVRLTTSGMYSEGIVQRIILPRDMDFLIVEDPIYIGLGSATTSIANIGSARIFCEEVRLSDLAKVSALAESANA